MQSRHRLVAPKSEGFEQKVEVEWLRERSTVSEAIHMGVPRSLARVLAIVTKSPPRSCRISDVRMRVTTQVVPPCEVFTLPPTSLARPSRPASTNALSRRVGQINTSLERFLSARWGTRRARGSPKSMHNPKPPWLG